MANLGLDSENVSGRGSWHTVAPVKEISTESGGDALVDDDSSICMVGDPGTGDREILVLPIAVGNRPGDAGEGDGEEETGLSGLSPALPSEVLPIEMLLEMPPPLPGIFSALSMLPVPGCSKKHSLSSSVSPADIGPLLITMPCGVPISMPEGFCQSQP